MAGAVEASAEPVLSVAPATSTEGHATLSWSLPAAVVDGVLQQSTDPAFPANNPALIETPIAASGTLVQTGLADGTYYFRAGVPGQWSGVQQLQVQHHSLFAAFFYFALGLFVFAVLVAVILHGSLRHGARDA